MENNQRKEENMDRTYIEKKRMDITTIMEGKD